MDFVFDDIIGYSEEVSQGVKEYLIVIIYDVVDNKRRNKIAKLLSGYGKRVQKKAFECILRKKKYEKLINDLERLIRDEDLLRVYKVSGQADVKIWGDIALTEFDDVIII